MIRFAGIAFVILAIALRVLIYLDNRPFWYDEAAIALNIRARSLLGLFQPLDFGQIIPLPHLFLPKLLAIPFGDHELVYRVPIFLAGCALPVIVWRWYPALVGEIETVVILGFLAVYQPLVYYAAELKQYGVDAAVSAVIAGLALRFLRGKADSRGWGILIAGGSIGLCVSQPAAFLLAGVGMALLADPRARRERTWIPRCILVGLVWVLTFVALHGSAYRRTADSAFMQGFWEEYLLNPGPNWLPRILKAAWFMAGIEHLPGTRIILVGLLFSGGVVVTWRRLGMPAAVLMSTPFAAVVAASMLGAYPIAPRLILFTAPLLFWGIGSALAAIVRGIPGRAGWLAGSILFLWLWAPAAIRTTRFALSPPEIEPTPEFAAEIDRIDPTAPVLVIFGGYLGWTYYTGDWSDPGRLTADARLFFVCETTQPTPPVCDRLTFRSRNPARPILIAPRLIGQPEGEWIEVLAGRIRALPDRRLWVFASNYPEPYRSGHLVERLFARLKATETEAGFPVTQGLSTLYRVALP